MIEVQAPILAGDSGGPLSNRAGKVIGMDTAASAARGADSGMPTFGFAIPINRALSIAAQIERGDTSGGAKIGGRGYLGIQVTATDPATNNGGAQITGTTPNSPAAAAGLEPGDIVTTLDGQPVASADGLTQSLASSKPGQQVTVGWTDPEGQAHDARVTLASGPAD
jgi:S1-C subfamily serine protease